MTSNGMKEAQLRTPRGDVWYLRSEPFRADRPTMVLLHGLTADHTLFDRQIPCFVAAYNLIVWDAPAHGRSRPYEDFSYANAAEDLKRILDDNGVARAVFIGQSMGGFIIQYFLLRYPERAEAFVGVDTCPYGERYYSKSDRWWLRQIEWMAKFYPTGLLKRSVAKQCTRSAYAFCNMRAALAPYEKNELCRLMGIGMAGFLTDNRDMQIGCPLLILCGEHDRTGKVKRYCRAWAEDTGAPLVMIPEAAHNANADNPARVNAAICAFLKGVGLPGDDGGPAAAD